MENDPKIIYLAFFLKKKISVLFFWKKSEIKNDFVIYISLQTLFFFQSFGSQVVVYVYLKKEVMDQADFLRVDKYQEDIL